MPPTALFTLESPRAARQAKTDRLILARLLTGAATSRQLDNERIAAAHAVLVRWADLETGGRLERFTETQMQGQFLAQVFGDALGYTQPSENAEVWHQVQHHSIAGQTPDAVLGRFSQSDPGSPLAVVELKGPEVHLDRDRSNGRTAVDQCWDYLNNTPPTCRWGIVSNIISFRLYERDSTKRAYEHFTLQSLRDLAGFRRFYVLFNRRGLIEGWNGYPPLAVGLLRETNEAQKQVGEKLYAYYSEQRVELIQHLISLGESTETAIEMAQRLFDRIVFIAFCEDRRLLPEHTIPKAREAAGFHAVTNPRWQNFKNLFRFIDAGNETHGIPKYNGGLFAPHPVDDLELPDEPWTTVFNTISGYDFRDEVTLDVLGHLFERSITELEKYKATGIFNLSGDRQREFASMPQSVKRKQLGIYYTPPELTSRIVQYTVEELIAERFAALAEEFGIAADDARRGVAPDDREFWQQCLATLQDLKIVDPACGSGAFLFQAYNALEQRYNEVVQHLDGRDGGAMAGQIPQWILERNLYGVDLSPEAVEITQLALWIRSASRGQTLATLSRNIVHGNSLVHDPAIHPAGFDWRQRFPEVFGREQAGFDCVIGNPPWERIKLQEREFFSLPAPEIATATNAAKRRQLVAKLETESPELFEQYNQALASSELLLAYCRQKEQYPLTGRGDINLYAVFAELAYQIVAPNGRVGLLTPSGIASDLTTKDFFAAITESNRLIRLYDFENQKSFFPEVHASFRFCILNFGGRKVCVSATDFVFFVHQVEELEDPSRHIALSGADFRLLNPNTKTCPIFRSNRDAEITKAIYRRVPVLIDHGRTGPTGNPWGIKFKTVFHQTNDAELFRDAATLKGERFKLVGNRWVKGKQTYLPLYEAKMIRPYDHRYGSVFEDTANWINQGQTSELTLVQHQNPEHLAQPRWWSSSSEVIERVQERVLLIGFRDVTRATDHRTLIATGLPFVAATNKIPIILTSHTTREELCLLANLNVMAADFCVKQKFGGISLNFFILEQLPILNPDAYSKRCPWNQRQSLEKWISERVLKLTCTAEDMLPLAEACEFTGGSFRDEYGGKLNKWDEAERAALMAELDAAYFHLYGIDRDDAEYILSTFKGIHERSLLLPGHQSVAENILSEYDRMARPR